MKFEPVFRCRISLCVNGGRTRKHSLRASAGLDFKDSRALKIDERALRARASTDARQERNENENVLPAASLGTRFHDAAA